MKTIVKQSLAVVFLLSVNFCLKAQIGIGTNAPDTSAILEIKSTKKGILLPRVDDVQSADKVKGSLLYDNASGKFKFYDGTQWLSVNPLNPDVSDNVTTVGNLTVTGNAAINVNTTITGTIQVNGASASMPNATSVSAPQATITGNSFVGYGTIPLGGIIMWSGTVVPEGWALCNGGTVNGFQTPDLSGRFIAGYATYDSYYNQPGNLSEKGTNKGNTGGEAFHQLTKDEIPQHAHSISEDKHSHEFTYNWRKFEFNHTGGSYMNTGPQVLDDTDTITTSEYKHAHGGFTGTGEGLSNIGGKGKAHENRPPYYVLAFIMRVK